MKNSSGIAMVGGTGSTDIDLHTKLAGCSLVAPHGADEVDFCRATLHRPGNRQSSQTKLRPCPQSEFQYGENPVHNFPKNIFSLIPQ